MPAMTQSQGWFVALHIQAAEQTLDVQAHTALVALLWEQSKAFFDLEHSLGESAGKAMLLVLGHTATSGGIGKGF